MGLSIEGFAIVSRDGMFAGADGADAELAEIRRRPGFPRRGRSTRAALLVHGRMSHEAQPNSCSRKRLLLTRCGRPVLAEPRRTERLAVEPGGDAVREVCEALEVDAAASSPCSAARRPMTCSSTATPSSISAAPAR